MRVLAISGNHLPKGNTSMLIGMITDKIEGSYISGRGYREGEVRLILMHGYQPLP